MLKLSANFDLVNLNSFHLNAKAGIFIEPETKKHLTEFLGSRNPGEPLLILGGGTNLLLTGDFSGTVIHPVNRTLEISCEEGDEVRVLAGAGINWDAFVQWSLDRNYGGLENLSGIPGTVGAAPVQNIGAYGAEAGQSIREVKVVDIDNGTESSLTGEQCLFGYRDSIFKKPGKQNWLIWEVEFSLSRAPIPKVTYEPLAEALEGFKNPSLLQVREAVIRIRNSKLPDPELTGNAGSFFKNPVVTDTVIDLLQMRYPGIPVFLQEGGSGKIPAGWLIEQCGWKGFRKGPVGVYPKQALVLVNYGGATAAQILDLVNRIEESVFEKFGIRLEREVRVV
jgi:UDP-N-acetylmuramate dehydrogenase